MPGTFIEEGDHLLKNNVVHGCIIINGGTYNLGELESQGDTRWMSVLLSDITYCAGIIAGRGFYTRAPLAGAAWPGTLSHVERGAKHTTDPNSKLQTRTVSKNPRPGRPNSLPLPAHLPSTSRGKQAQGRGAQKQCDFRNAIPTA